MAPKKKQMENDSVTYICHAQNCTETFNNRMARKRHMDKDHPNEEKAGTAASNFIHHDEGYECQICHTIISSRNNIARHFASCGNNESEKESFKCPDCEIEFKYKSKLNVHLATHKKLLMICDKCNAVYQRSDHFQKHVEKCDGMPLDNINTKLPTLVPVRHCSSFAQYNDIPGDEHNDIDMTVGETEDTFNGFNSTASTEQIVPSMQFESAAATSIEKDKEEIYHEMSLYSVDGSFESFQENILETELKEKRDNQSKRKEKSRKTKLIENILHSVEEGKRREVLENAIAGTSDEYKSEITFTSAKSVFEGKICGAFIKYLKKLLFTKKTIEFCTLIIESFADDMADVDFIRFLSSKLGIKPCIFLQKLSKCNENEFTERRGRKKLPDDIRQIIYDEWLENSIPSVDRRNGREFVKMAKASYMKQFDCITDVPELKEERNKRGKLQMIANRRVQTCTVESMKKKLEIKHHVPVSNGTIFSLKPFFLSQPTEKEKQMCLCKNCLNLRLEFNALMKHSRENDGPNFDSMSEFFMQSCQCEKSDIEYWKYDCCVGDCSECKEKIYPEIPNLSDEKIKYYVFEVTKKEYMCKKTKETKTSKNTERVEKETSSKELYDIICSKAEKYTKHRHQVVNDKVQFNKIVNTAYKYGRVFWIDFSENLSGTPKWEPQDAHFSKTQISLHCTLSFEPDGAYNYIYHLSNDTGHDAKHSSAVVQDILSLHDPREFSMYRFKSDNCTAQYKCCNIFPFWRNLSITSNKAIICYYGVSGHGKGMVDGMSAFGVKEPLRKAIITEDIFYNTAEDIHAYLCNKMKDKGDRKYCLIESSVINQIRETDKEQLKIDGCMKFHMFSYFPNGSIQAKVNMCACDHCLIGEFVKCSSNEKGVFIEEIEESCEALDEWEDEDDGENSPLDITKAFFTHDDFQVGSYIAIYSHSDANELFYICLVRGVGYADEELTDKYQHSIPKGNMFLSCNYLEKDDAKSSKRHIKYKLLHDTVYIRAEEVFYPSVTLTDDLKLHIEDYVFLSDCI